MRRIRYQVATSLDGFIAGPKGELDWATFDQEVDDAGLPPMLERSDTALLGRGMYEQFYGYWPSKQPPFFSKGEEQFANWINSVPKVVFSTTLSSVEWNGRVVSDGLAAEVEKLKREPGKDMLLAAGTGLPQTFARMGLVDEYRLLVSPVVLGSGKPLFGQVQDRMKLKLLDAHPFKAGAVLLTYEKA